MHRSIYLLWLPIALLGISVHGQNAHLNARDVLASEIEDIQAQFGDSVDTSLEGYDHDLVTRDEESSGGSTWEAVRDLPAKAARILKPHHKVVQPDEDWEPISKRELIEHQKRAMKAMYGNNIDFSLEGYDESLLDDEEEYGDDEIIEKRDVGEEDEEDDEDDEEIDYSLEGYDTSLLQERDLEIEEPEEKEDGVDYSLEGYDFSVLSERDLDDAEEEGEDEEIDFSLEGYNESLLQERDLGEEEGEEEDDGEEDVLPEGDGSPYDADFDPSSYLEAWDSGIHARDFADDDDLDGSLATEPIGEEDSPDDDDEVDVNDRYFDDGDDEEGDVEGDVERRDVEHEEEEEDDGDWFEAVKRWVGLE